MAIPATTRGALPVAAMVAVFWLGTAARSAESPIRFAHHPIAFTLESCETPDRHVPETMAGGVAVFDFENDGWKDLFVSCAHVQALHAAPQVPVAQHNAVFHNEKGVQFTFFREDAGLAC